jgi:hypothetical protein
MPSSPVVEWPLARRVPELLRAAVSLYEAPLLCRTDIAVLRSRRAGAWPRCHSAASTNFPLCRAAETGAKPGWHYALPAPDGPLATLGLEAIRQGIDDARYVALLKKVNPSAVKALLSEIEPFSASIPDWVEAHPGNSPESLRWKFARAAMAAGR